MLRYQQNYRIHGEKKKKLQKDFIFKKEKLQKIIDRHWEREREME